jgi:zinc transport system permease protein
MFEYLAYGFVQRALIGGVAIAIIASILGPFLVLRRLSVLGDGLAHVAFAGIAIGLLLGTNPIISAIIVTAIASLLIMLLIKKIPGDAATAILMAFGLSVALIILGFAKSLNADLLSYLFGSILTMSTTDIVIILGVLVLTLLFIFVLYKKLVFLTFNEELARLRGVRSELLSAIIAVLASLAVVVGMRAVGILLVSAMLVIPTVTALQLSSSFFGTLIISSIVNVIAVILGIMIAFALDLPPGGVIVLLLCVTFVVSFFARKR